MEGGKEVVKDELMLEQQGCGGSSPPGERPLRPHCVLCCSCGAVSTQQPDCDFHHLLLFLWAGTRVNVKDVCFVFLAYRSVSGVILR